MELLRTSRIIIESFNDRDAAFVLELLHSPGWLLYIGRRDVETIEAARQYIAERFATGNKDGMGCFALRLIASGTTIGLISFLKRDYLDAPDIGYALLPGCDGQGYAYEATDTFLRHVTDKGHLHIYAIVTPGNKRSISLLSKLQFRVCKTVHLPDEALLCFERTF